jgi:hypothetical protein
LFWLVLLFLQAPVPVTTITIITTTIARLELIYREGSAMCRVFFARQRDLSVTLQGLKPLFFGETLLRG